MKFKQKGTTMFRKAMLGAFCVMLLATAPASAATYEIVAQGVDVFEQKPVSVSRGLSALRWKASL